MVALSDTHAELGVAPDFDQAKALRESLKTPASVNRGGRIFLGSVLCISALGLWLVPVDAGDAAMQLIKLLVSVVMLALGMMFIFSINRRAELPEIQIDTLKRELRVIKRDHANNPFVEAFHAFENMAEINLKGHHLSARDADGQVIVSVPLRDKATARALQAALDQVS